MALDGWGWSEVTPDSSAVLTTAEVKKHLEIETSDTAHDSAIDALVVAAVELFQKSTRVQLLTRTDDLVIDDFPADCEPVSVPRAPVSSITSINYNDADGAAQTLSSSNYVVSTHKMPCQISLAADQSDWPETQDQADSVTIRIVSGYGAAADVPTAIKQSLLMLVAHWFENREAVLVGSISKELPFAVNAIWNKYMMGDSYQVVSG